MSNASSGPSKDAPSATGSSANAGIPTSNGSAAASSAVADNIRFIPRRRKRVLALNARSLKAKIEGYDELLRVDGDVPEVVIEDEDPSACERDDPHEYWMWLARRIRDKYTEFDGFVVLQGIDTMCNTASVLAFLFENLGKPVALTGAVSAVSASQSDWRRNFVLSVLYAGGTLSGAGDTCEVVIVFAEQVFRGTRAILESTSAMQPFSSPKFPPLATMHGHRLIIEPGRYLRAPTGPLIVHTDVQLPEVLLLTVTPSVSERAIVRLVNNSRARGLVLLAYGAGNVPFANPTVVRVAQQADARGMIVVVQTQVRRGSVELGVYYTSGPLSQFAVSAGDMTVEATVAKLKYLLGRQMWSKSDIKVLMQRSLRGELTEHLTSPASFRPRL
jgi:L-asparaginase